MKEPRDPRESLPTEKLEGGLRAALRHASEDAPGGVFGALERLAGSPSRILLANAEAETPGPVIAPAAPADQRLSRGKGQYRVDGELARGGMGVVLKGHDTDLGRDVALKVMHPELSSRAESVQRFVEEAQIGGQLQHPGIVPVYELGLMADERPYFAMKLIKGRTLASLFADRESPGSDQRRFLGIFEQVCQTVAYAHARGVIHRDLKPSNVMVGAFGEVQVVDWGLAKVLPRGGVADEERARNTQVSVIETVRSEHGSSHSRAGSVMGTPAYMAPEQARGEVAEVTERADVFSLGAILCELLTGSPPYTGEHDAVMTRAAEAELQDAQERLAGCPADEALVALTSSCLAPAPGARPRNAGTVARAVQDHLASVEQRAREARLEAERARSRAVAERKARRLTAALAVTLLIAVLGGGAGYAFVENKRQSRRMRVTGLVNDALNEAAIERAQGHLDAALAAAERARALAQPGEVKAELRGRVGELLASVEEQARRAREEAAREERDADLLERLDQVRTLEFNEPLDGGTGVLGLRADSHQDVWGRRDQAYAAVFAETGLPVELGAIESTAQLMRESGIAVEIALRLDDWARVVRKVEGGDSRRANALFELGSLTDVDPDRSSMRAAIVDGNVEELRSLARDATPEELHPTTLNVLANGLEELGALEEAVALLERAQPAYPDDFTINFNLGVFLGRLSPEDRRRGLRFLHAAVASKPDSPLAWSGLGQAFWRDHDFEAAASAFERGLELGEVHLYTSLIQSLVELKRYREALDASRRFLVSSPEDAWAHAATALLYERIGNLAEAQEYAERATELGGDDAHVLCAQARVLISAGKLDRAAPLLREASPGRFGCIDVSCHIPASMGQLALAFQNSGRFSEAVHWYEEALSHRPAESEVNYFRVNLAESLAVLQRTAEALAEVDRLIALDAGFPFAHSLRAQLMLDRGDHEEALRAARRAIEVVESFEVTDDSELENLDRCVKIAYAVQGACGRALQDHDLRVEAWARLVELEPEVASHHHELGDALKDHGDVDAALIEWEAALRLDPGNASLFYHLAAAYVHDRDWPDHDPDLGKELAEQGLAIDPQNLNLRCTLALAGMRLGQWPEAIDALHRALELPGWEQPRPWYRRVFGEALNGHAWELVAFPDADSARYEEGLECALLATELLSDQANLWNTLGVAWYRAGDWQGSVEALERAVELRGADHPLDHLVLALAHERLGEAGVARDHYRRATLLSEGVSSVGREEVDRFEEEARELLGIGGGE